MGKLVVEVAQFVGEFSVERKLGFNRMGAGFYLTLLNGIAGSISLL